MKTIQISVIKLCILAGKLKKSVDYLMNYYQKLHLASQCCNHHVRKALELHKRAFGCCVPVQFKSFLKKNMSQFFLNNLNEITKSIVAENARKNRAIESTNYRTLLSGFICALKLGRGNSSMNFSLTSFWSRNEDRLIN